MTRMRSLLLVCAAIVVSLPAPTLLSAQGPMMFEGFAARKQQSADPLFGGLGFTGYNGIFGLRVSGSLNVGKTDGPEEATNFQFTQCGALPTPCQTKSVSSSYRDRGLYVGGWTADADVLVEPFRKVPVVKSLLLGFSPYGFFGVGGSGLRPEGGADTSFATLSYGLGAHHNLLSWLGVGVEARYRRPLRSDSALTVGTPRSWEYRLGLTASFGGGTPFRRYRPEPPRPQIAERVYIAPPPPRRYIIESNSLDSRFASRVLATADEYVGTKFRSGGASPHSGFDGAGFVNWVFWREGVRLPRSARRMADLGERVSTRAGALRPGDLLFFANDGYSINHVAIYVGGDRFIHSSSTGNGVRYDTLGERDRGRWFSGHLVQARRITSNERWSDSYYDDDPAAPDRAPRPSRW